VSTNVQCVHNRPHELGVGLKKIRISRHAISGSQQLTFGLLNVQSANNKTDDIIDKKIQHRLDVMLLTKTWDDVSQHHAKSLRAKGLHFIKRSRPRSSVDGVNHGGVAIAASPGVRLSSSVVINQRSV
jgi:hypothetical protein